MTGKTQHSVEFLYYGYLPYFLDYKTQIFFFFQNSLKESIL